eukprot:321625-Alexandrium_andersonii.AAC.1
MKEVIFCCSLATFVDIASGSIGVAVGTTADFVWKISRNFFKKFLTPSDVSSISKCLLASPMRGT